MAVLDNILKRWPIVALLVSAAMLAIAHAFQTFGGLRPCHLCLLQRDVYWWAMGVAAIALAAMLTRYRTPAPRIADLILAAVFLVGAGIAGFHAGAEWKWWPAPQSCAAGARVSAADIQALLAGRGVAAPACDRAPWVFLGLSMAGWNFLISIALAGASLCAAVRREKTA